MLRSYYILANTFGRRILSPTIGLSDHFISNKNQIYCAFLRLRKCDAHPYTKNSPITKPTFDTRKSLCIGYHLCYNQISWPYSIFITFDIHLLKQNVVHIGVFSLPNKNFDGSLSKFGFKLSIFKNDISDKCFALHLIHSNVHI